VSEPEKKDITIHDQGKKAKGCGEKKRKKAQSVKKET